jgi:hypothetical protein
MNSKIQKKIGCKMPVETGELLLQALKDLKEKKKNISSFFSVENA